MSLSRRSSLSPPQPVDSTRELKHRVITCLNKLSDRDTLAVAATELDSIARNLTHDLYSPFITCIHTTDSSEKSPVRKQCVRLLGLLSETHGDALSPHLSKMISTVIRRLRDPDSSVRSACINAVTAMSLQITKPPFSAFLKSFMDVILTEQDHNSQIGSALCLAAAIEASPDPEPAQLSKVLPKLLKLAKSEGFKAKPALLSLISSVVGAGGASSRGALNCLVPLVVEFLSSEDWAARKAAAEVLGKVAILDRVLVAEYKKPCLDSLESRRFDKVKVVRDTMNHTLDLWKKVSDASEVVLSPSESNFSSRDSRNEGCSPPVSKNSQDVASETMQLKKATPTSRSPPSNDSLLTSTTKKKSAIKTNDKKSYTAIACKLDYSSDRKNEVAMPHSSSEIVCEDDFNRREAKVSESAENEDIRISKLETRRVLFSKIRDDNIHRFGHVKSGSRRVVPILESEISELAAVGSNATEEVYGDHKDIEDMNLIRKQLVQIENQQTNLLGVLQRFIGSSQNGMNSLETRVHGLEMALGEISYDLAVSTGSIANTDSTCCKLPGTEFLSPKFWRRTEGRYSAPRFSSYGSIGSPNSICSMPDKYARAETTKLGNQRLQQQNGDQYIVLNSSAAICSDRRRNLEFPNRTLKNINRGADRVHVRNAGELNGSSIGTCGTPMNLSNK